MKTGRERWIDFKDMKANFPPTIAYGVPFLDKATDGIFVDDLVLVAAKQGSGKTELLSQIAMNALKDGKRVHFFALEAYKGEVEARIMFRHLANAFYFCHGYDKNYQRPKYQSWLKGDPAQKNILDKFEPEIESEVLPLFDRLSTYYTDDEYSPKNFEDDIHAIKGKTDLVIVDHLHYFDLQADDENKALKSTMKQIRKLFKFYRVPVVMATQLRKADKYSRGLLPSLDDIHGSSDVTKIATRVIAVAPSSSGEGKVFETYMRMLKNRLDGASCFYTGLCGFNISKNQYSPEFKLGTLKKDDTKWEEIERLKWPDWAI